MILFRATMFLAHDQFLFQITFFIG